jgi:hypothetical protein
MSWGELQAELDAWHAARRRATLWWRDDAVADWSPALYRLLRIAEAGPVPVALAVVPAQVERRLAQRLARHRRLRVLQHGYALANHAGAGAPPNEFPPDHLAAAGLGEICHGWLRLSELFGRTALPVFVAPWNRVAPDLPRVVGELGFQGLSAFGPRAEPPTADGAMRVNAHVDPMDWSSEPAFAGEATVLGALIAHLRARRLDEADRQEPTGLLTHHLELDEAAWVFLERLVSVTTGHPAVRWLAPDTAFARAERVGSYLWPLSSRAG